MWIDIIESKINVENLFQTKLETMFISENNLSEMFYNVTMICRLFLLFCLNFS